MVQLTDRGPVARCIVSFRNGIWLSCLVKQNRTAYRRVVILKRIGDE